MPDYCPVCTREVPVVDGVYGIHYNSGLLRCETSGQPAAASPEPAAEPTVESPVEPVKKPAKKAAPRKKPAKP